MEENKIESKKGNNTILVVIIILLVFVVGILIGYILVDKTYQSKTTTQEKTSTPEEKKEKDPEATITEPEKEQSAKTITSVSEFPQTSDESFVKYGELIALLSEDEVRSNITEVTKNHKGSTITFKCIENGKVSYNPEEEPVTACKSYQATIDNKLIYEFNNPYEFSGGCSRSEEFYKNENHYIKVYTEGCTRRGIITIYNKNGEEEMTINSVTYYYNASNGTNPTQVAFQNDKMYYIDVETVNEQDGAATLLFKEMDLSTSTLQEKVIEQFNGKIGTK